MNTPPQQGRGLIDDLEGIANSITLDHDGLLTNHAVKIHEAVAELERLCAEVDALKTAVADTHNDRERLMADNARLREASDFARRCCGRPNRPQRNREEWVMKRLEFKKQLKRLTKALKEGKLQ